MRQYLQDLLERICTVEELVNSKDSVSWAALREAEGLTDLSMVTELTEYLATNPKKDKRQAVYFIVGKIGKNLQDLSCASVLLTLIEKEKDKYALSSLLDRIADIQKPSEMDLKPIYNLLNDKRWLVRHSAIQALNNTNSPEVEDKILTVLAGSNDPDDLVYCQSTLNRVGSIKSLPVLEKSLKSRKRDVKHSAQAAIEAIEARYFAQQGVPADAEKRRG